MTYLTLKNISALPSFFRRAHLTLSTAVPKDMPVAARQPTSLVVGMIGVKGGVGSSTLALNTAACMSTLFGRTTIFDANLYQPDIAFMVGAPTAAARDLRDLASAAQLDDSLVVACQQTILSGQLFLLTAPPSGEAILQIDLETVSTMLGTISKASGSWLLDLPKTLDKNLVSIIDQCQVIVLVTDTTAVSLSGARRWLAVLNDLGHSRVILAINRSNGLPRISEECSAALHSAGQVVHIPGAYQLMQANVAGARPTYSPLLKDPYSKSINQLVRDIARTAG